MKKLSRGIVALFTIGFLFLSVGTAWAWTYYVQKGDSLYLIGQRYGSSAQQLKAANSLSSNTIYPGQELWIPENTYTVKAGDTLYNIGIKYGVTVNAIKNANRLNSSIIWPGQQLSIPGADPASPARTGNTTSRSGSTYSRDEVMLLAQLIYGEARGESYAGQVAVAAVALNRVKHPAFPNTLRGVIFESWAFTAVHDGQFYLKPDQTAIRAAEEALKGWDPTNGALYYWNPVTATNKWVWSRTITSQIGKHVFAV